MISKVLFVGFATAALAMSACDGRQPEPQADVVEPVPAAKKAAKRAGADDRYATKSPDAQADVGKSTEVEFRIEPRGDLKINKEYPWKIEFHEVDGMAFENAILGADTLKLTDEAATIPLSLTASRAGKSTLKATGSFSVCNPQRCDILRDEPLEFTVVAVASADEPAPE
jgi:hypothetical protein